MKALKVTKGKRIDTGVVFVDGKFIDPPYVVERYGNVIRINQVQVTKPIVEWAEFLKTQPEATVTETVVEPPPEPAPVAATPTPAAKPVVATKLTADDDDDLLDSLFEDDSPKAKPVAEKPPEPAPASPPPKPEVVKKVRLESPFELNDRAKGLVAKVNLMRRDIDAALRRGGFFCFGSTYSRVSGDKELALKIMERLPQAMRRNSELGGFSAELRKAGFVFFPPPLVRDLFAHRLDYLRLQKRGERMKSNAELDAMLERSGATTF